MFAKSLYYPETGMFAGLFLSVVLGFAVGLEREVTNKSAGLRTNIMVCAGSCLFTLLSIYGFAEVAVITTTRGPARIAAQILTGIGFIGGGTVLRHGTSVYGLTTAATLWMSASIGMACGCGKYTLACVAALVTIFILTMVRWFERICITKRKKCLRDFALSILCRDKDFGDISGELAKIFPGMTEITKKESIDAGKININCRLSVRDENPLEFILENLKSNRLIITMSVKELNN